MARKNREQFGNLFAESKEELFVEKALNAQADFNSLNNPYVGNKRKILADIAIELNNELSFDSFSSVLDLFAGSAVVGAFFKKLGKKVYSNELLRSSYMNGVSLTQGWNHKISDQDWEFLVSNKNPKSDGFMEKTHGGSRLTSKESVFIDNYFANVEELFVNDHIRNCIAHSTMMQFIMSHCFVGGRLNSGQIIASLEHRLQHQRNNNNEMNFQTMKPSYFVCEGLHSVFFNSDVFDFCKTVGSVCNFDLIYIDPPYGGQQSDYAFMYQFLEEYLARKSFEEIEYLKIASKSFSKAKTYKDHFRQLLGNLDSNAVLAISYNDSSWADIETIKGLVSEFRENVIVKTTQYDYKYRSAENSVGVEYLIIGQNNGKKR
jgi:adenine-specific DNA-methyltransferase